MPGPILVEVGGDLERAFRTLKKQMAYEGIFKELKSRRYYEKPSEEKKRRKEEAVRRRMKKVRKFSYAPGPTTQAPTTGGGYQGRGRPMGGMGGGRPSGE